MDATALPNNIGFHDSSLTELSLDGDCVRLRFEDVWVRENNSNSATVTLRGVRRMSRDDQVVDTVRMEADDAEVLTFRVSGNTATLLVVWISHSARTDDTRSYEFDFATFDLQIETQT